jgi:hypothetical protein
VDILLESNDVMVIGMGKPNFPEIALPHFSYNELSWNLGSVYRVRRLLVTAYPINRTYCLLCQHFLNIHFTLHDDLKVPFTKDVIQEKSVNHHEKLGNHSNPMLQPLLEEQQRRRIKKLWPADLIDG